MIDSSTQRQIRVLNVNSARPHMFVPVEQLEKIEAALRKAQVTYWVDVDAISLDGGPEFTVVNLKRGGDGEKVQALLDQLQ